MCLVLCLQAMVGTMLLYLAGEVNGNISFFEYKLTNTEYLHGTLSQTTFTIKNSEGISVLPDFFLQKIPYFMDELAISLVE